MFRMGVLTLAIALLATGCAGYGAPPAGAPPAGGEEGTGPASFEIVSPEPRASVAGPSVTIELASQNLTVQPAGGANDPNRGHFHIFVDQGGYEVVYEPTYTVTVGPGEHTVRVELRNNDHSAFNPSVVREVTFTVTGSADAPVTEAAPTPGGYDYNYSY